jgi:hypothetical protein
MLKREGVAELKKWKYWRREEMVRKSHSAKQRQKGRRRVKLAMVTILITLRICLLLLLLRLWREVRHRLL